MKNEVLINHHHLSDSYDPIPICSKSGEHSYDEKFRQSDFC